MNGIIWSGINACTAVLMPMGLFVFFARTASLETIGAVALATSCLEILKSLALPGLYEAVLQQADDQERCHETVAFVLLGLASVLAAIYLLGVTALSFCLPSVAAHYLSFVALGSRIVLDLAALQPQAQLGQRLAYRRLAIRTMMSTSAGGLAGVAVTLRWDALAGLVSYQVCQSLAFLLATIVGTGAAAFPRLHRACLDRMWREATLATGVRILAAGINNLDQIVAAALMGSAPLALYNLGKRFEATFVTVAGSFSTILFQPFFARRHIEQRSQNLGPSVALMTVVLGLPAAVFVANGDWLVPAVFGKQWQQAASVAVVMVLAGFVRAVGYIPGALMSVSIQNGRLFAVSLISLLSGLVLLALATPFGIVWCATTVLVRHLGILGWMTASLRDKAGRPVHTLIGCFAVPTVLMIAGALAGRALLSQTLIAEGLSWQLLLFVASAVLGAVAGGVYFAVWFRTQLGGYCTMLRARVASVP
jgi:PST family polysaccharide transporter